jgi:hypothetical protein
MPNPLFTYNLLAAGYLASIRLLAPSAYGLSTGRTQKSVLAVA